MIKLETILIDLERRVKSLELDITHLEINVKALEDDNKSLQNEVIKLSDPDVVTHSLSLPGDKSDEQFLCKGLPSSVILDEPI